MSGPPAASSRAEGSRFSRLASRAAATASSSSALRTRARRRFHWEKARLASESRPWPTSAKCLVMSTTSCTCRLGETLGFKDRLVAQQLDVQICDIEQDFVGRRLCMEL